MCLKLPQRKKLEAEAKNAFFKKGKGIVYSKIDREMKEAAKLLELEHHRLPQR